MWKRGMGMSVTDSAKSEAESAGVVWGKWHGLASPYPLLAHLLDTAAFAAGLWDTTFSRSMRLTCSLGFGPGESHGRAGFAFLAASHDCGKAEPWFQGQVTSRNPSEFADNSGLLAEAGLDAFPDAARLLQLMRNDGGNSIRRMLRHEAGSAAALERADAPAWAVAAVSGHHGRYMPDASPQHSRPVQAYRDWIRGSGWAQEQQRDLNLIASAVDWSGFAAEAHTESQLAGLIPLVTGAICLADWLASDEVFIRSAPLELLADDPREYFLSRATQAAELIPSTVGIPVRPRGSFGEVFPGFSADREVQRWAVDHGNHGPGLSVIAVPMGEGKTETALWMHSASDVDDGLIFALPTMATADAMFSRVQAFYSGTPALAALRHGMASLNAFYDPAGGSPTDICDDEGGLTGSEWLQGRHRSLTAPVTVSSCDQVLAAAVNHKFSPVRLSSLAGKHVVLDEVHTYDPYQDMLLTRLLGWLGRFSVRVTLLSATLPTRRVRDYARAYAQGAGCPVNGEILGLYPCVTTTSPDGTTTQFELAAHRSYSHGVHVSDMVVTGTTFDEFTDEYATATAAYVDALREQHPEACIGVIVNTVGRANAIAMRLTGERRPLVIHSRMTAQQRSERTSELLALTGPGATPGTLTFVATQIAESSLDIDVDILVTDLAPVASLLQRMGRQWRHSQFGGRGWSHSEGRHRPTNEPVAHVLVARDPSGVRHVHAAIPYSNAEVDKTLAHGLEHGARTVIVIPDDLQGLVDGCDVTLNDLTEVDTDRPELGHVLAHLGESAAQEGQARRVGTDHDDFAVDWELNPSWAANPTLDALTSGTLWDAEAITRLRDGDTLQLLVYDPTGATAYALGRTPDALVANMQSLAQSREALRCVVPVSGRVATRISRFSTAAAIPQEWSSQPTAILRDLRPVSVSELAALGLTLDPILGLTSE
ncbi:unannotated protein [freshwater metagenome]|uniref:Unannotated protein n=1 Tax=freshwater metagenome TaxID=449393 RepID=A0A6J7KYQ3_9ZZZZ